MARINLYWDDRDPGEIGMGGVPRGSVTEQEESVLQDIFEGKRRVLEIGTGLGSSTRAIASVAKEVVTVDIDPWVQEVIWKELPENVITTTEPEKLGPFDGAFIDGNHSEGAVSADIEKVLPLLEAESPIVFHDYHFPGVNEAVRKSGLPVLAVYSTKLPMCMCKKMA